MDRQAAVSQKPAHVGLVCRHDPKHVDALRAMFDKEQAALQATGPEEQDGLEAPENSGSATIVAGDPAEPPDPVAEKRVKQ